MAVGLFLAFLVLSALVLLSGGKEGGGYCSPEGRIGPFEARSPGKTVAYVDEGWSGLPPRTHCSVYRVDNPPGSRDFLFTTSHNDPPTADELVRRDPSPQLLKRGSYPEDGSYLWVFVALLLPPALWAMTVSLRGAATR